MIKGVDYPGVTTVFFCHDGEGNVLLGKRSKECRDEHGKWDPGGGGLQFGLSVIDNLKKEVKEEYCTDVLGIEFLGYRDVHREHEGKQTHWIALDFKVLIDKEKVQNGEPHKAKEIKWFSVDNLPEPLHSQFPEFLQLYEEKLKE